MSLLTLPCLVAGITLSPAQDPVAPADLAAVRSSVVKVLATVRYPNPLRPWMKLGATQTSGSGVVLEGGKILTNAHIVLYANRVFIQGHDEADRVPARVVAIGIPDDLAVIEPEDPTFFDRHPTLPRSEGLPMGREAVEVYGYPIGGDGLSVTKGIVSRVDLTSPSNGLRIQIDAAINPGNSGGPAVVDGEMIGLVSGRIGAAENVGLVIPNREINGFLEDIADGQYDGTPGFNVVCQTIESEAIRDRLKLGRDVKGVVVCEVEQSVAPIPLKLFDVITRIGETTIDNEGMVRIEGGVRVLFTYLISEQARGRESVTLGVIRDGEPINLDVPVTTKDRPLMPRYEGSYPSYFIYGPLAFSTAYRDAVPFYLRANPMLELIHSPLVERRPITRFPGEELVVVTSPMLPHDIARGYDDPVGRVVADVNGVEIRNLRHFVETIRDLDDPFVTIRFAEYPSNFIVFRREEVEDATREVMDDNGIAQRASEDLLRLWEAKSEKD